VCGWVFHFNTHLSWMQKQTDTVQHKHTLFTVLNTPKKRLANADAHASESHSISAWATESSQCVSATLCHSASLASSLSKCNSPHYLLWWDWACSTSPLSLFIELSLIINYLLPPNHPAVAVRNIYVRIFFGQRTLIFINTLMFIESEGLKVIRTCGLLCVEHILAGTHQNNVIGFSRQWNANFKSPLKC